MMKMTIDEMNPHDSLVGCQGLIALVTDMLVGRTDGLDLSIQGTDGLYDVLSCVGQTLAQVYDKVAPKVRPDLYPNDAGDGAVGPMPPSPVAPKLTEPSKNAHRQRRKAA